MIKTFEQFEAKCAECSAKLAAKFDGSNGMRAVVLCGGTGCLSCPRMFGRAQPCDSCL